MDMEQVPGGWQDHFRSYTNSRSAQIGEQIFRMPTPKKRRNTWCISSFFGKGRRKICRQDAYSGYRYSF